MPFSQDPPFDPDAINVVEWGAVPDVVGAAATNDTAFARAIAEAVAQNKPVLVPPQTFSISAAIAVNNTQVRIVGAGYKSKISQTSTSEHGIVQGTTSTSLRIENLYLEGPGSGTGIGIVLQSSNSSVIGCWLQGWGSHAIQETAGAVDNRIINCDCRVNGGDGINSVSDATGENGNALRVISCLLISNTGNGCTWSARGLLFSGNTVETNTGYGLEFDSSAASGRVLGATVTGCYFESNVAGQLWFSSQNSDRITDGVAVTGNYFTDNVAGAATLIGATSATSSAGISDLFFAGNKFVIGGSSSATSFMDLGNWCRRVRIEAGEGDETDYLQLGDDYSLHLRENNEHQADTGSSPVLRLKSADGSATNPVFEVVDNAAETQRFAIEDTGVTTITSASTPQQIVRTSSDTVTTKTVAGVTHQTDGAMSDGFGVAETFSVQDGAAGPFIIGQHSWILDDAVETTGRFIVTTYQAGAAEAKLYVDHRGIVLGSGGVPTGTVEAVMMFGNNGGDPTPASNQAGIYALADGGGNVEMWAIDEDSTKRQLTAPVNLTTDVTGVLPEANGGSHWDQAANVVYPNSITEDVAIGGTTSAGTFFFDVSLQTLTVNGDDPIITLNGNGGVGNSTIFNTIAGVQQFTVTNNDQNGTIVIDSTVDLYLDGPGDSQILLTTDKVGIRETAPDCFLEVGGAIHCHAETNAANTTSVYPALIIGDNANATDSYSAVVVGGRHGASEAEFGVLGIYDNGSTNRSIYYGGGNFDVPDAMEQTWYTAPTYTETTNTGVAQMRINDSGLQVGTVSGTAAAELEIDIRATGNVGLQIGAISGQTANLLECLAAADGFVVDSAGIPHIPVRTDANRGAAGTAGRMIFNTTSGMPEWDDGTNWVDATGATT